MFVWFARVLIGLMLSAPAVAQEPLRVQLLGELRPLSVPGADRFEQDLLREWAIGLKRPLQVVAAGEQADIFMGPQENGLAYYQSEPAALTRVQGGLSDLRELTRGTFCIVEGSPHAAVFATRFQATAKTYPTTAHALVGLRYDHCQAVIEDRVLLRALAEMPEWKGYARVLPPLTELAITFRVLARDAQLQSALQPLVDKARLSQEQTKKWINEVAFQAYVLSDTLDCHSGRP